MKKSVFKKIVSLTLSVAITLNVFFCLPPSFYTTKSVSAETISTAGKYDTVSQEPLDYAFFTANNTCALEMNANNIDI